MGVKVRVRCERCFRSLGASFLIVEGWLSQVHSFRRSDPNDRDPGDPDRGPRTGTGVYWEVWPRFDIAEIPRPPVAHYLRIRCKCGRNEKRRETGTLEAPASGVLYL